MKSALADDIETAANVERVADSRRAVQAFFRDLPEESGLPPSRILFVADGLRYPTAVPVASANVDTTYFVGMREYFLREARRRGYGTIDMDIAFFAHWRQYAERFEWPRDGQWNALAHSIAAKQIKMSGFLDRVFGAE